jgi:hypothetical protein
MAMEEGEKWEWTLSFNGGSPGLRITTTHYFHFILEKTCLKAYIPI